MESSRVKKTKYATDNIGRLLINKGGRLYPAEGEFKIEKNDLIFEPSRKSPLAEILSLPQSIKFKGNWHLNRSHNLELHLKEAGSKDIGGILELKGKILSCEADSLVFEMHCRKSTDEDRISLLSLSGRWQADNSNNLIFLVSRDTEEDILKLSAGWQVNNNHKLVYTYEKEDLVRKTRRTEYLEFDGYWQINGEKRISYNLDLKNNSFFEFRASIETLSLPGNKGKIKFRLGAGAKKQARETIFSLFGTWKVNAKGSISFEIDYGSKHSYSMDFTASVYLNRYNQFIFELKNKEYEDLGIAVKFKHKFLKNNARLFARLAKLDKEKRIEAGIKIIW